MEIIHGKFHMKNSEDIFKSNSLLWEVDREEEEMGGGNENFVGVYRELAELIGENATLKIWRHYSGLSITFPQKLYTRDYVKKCICESMDVKKAKDIAKELSLSERRVRQIIKEIKEGYHEKE